LGTPSEYIRELIRQDKERRMANLEQELLAAAKGPKIEVSISEIRKKGLITQSSAQIRGMVLDPHGAVIMGATVDLLSLEKARTTETDDSGKFEFLDLPLSTYDLQVRKAGFTRGPVQNISFGEPVVRQISIVLQLASPECLPKTHASYERPSDKTNLVGNVLDYSDGSVKDARLTVAHKETGTTYVANSNEKGDFQFASLQPGKYTLKVSHQKYAEMAGIDFWVTRENLTRLTTLYIFRKNKHLVIICQ
jgi:Carboxypeptidase regulatory-like domain